MRIPSLLPLASLLLSLSPSFASSAASSDSDFANTAIVRTIDLAGATTVITTTYTAKCQASSSAGCKEYTLGLGARDVEKLAGLEVREKRKGGAAVGGGDLLEWKESGVAGSDGSRNYLITLPTPLSPSESITLTSTVHLIHASVAKPSSVKQTEAQYLLWTGDVGVQSVYDTEVERIKIRTPNPTVLSHSDAPTEYTRDSSLTKSGSTLTLGPFYNVPGGTRLGEGFEVHYKHDDPVISIKTLKRHVEISHWGNNLNTQDDIVLYNSGPSLKGHFSRIDHQKTKHFRQPAPQVLSDFALHLPPHIKNPYYYDIIGNVSTSNFRPTPPAASKRISARSAALGGKGGEESLLELRPRYPILGGWNYTFTVGWDADLGDVLKKGESSGEYVLGVPFLTGLEDVAVDEVEFVVVLPEGASDVSVATPFPVDDETHFMHTTYLDFFGRPAVKLVKKRCSEKCGEGLVYVKYTMTTAAHLQKPMHIGAIVFGLFAALMALKRALGSGSLSAAEEQLKARLMGAGKKTE